MSVLVPCSSCGSRQPGKNSWCCWAWNRADGLRVAYKQRLCITCFSLNVINLIASANSGEFKCPVCGTDPGAQLDPVYLTYIVPGMGKEQADLALCAPCALEVRMRGQVGAELLENRDMGVGAATQGPNSSATSAWDALGLRP